MRKFRYIGDAPEITLRGVTFAKGKPVDLSDNPLLAEKVSVLPYFAEVKARKRKPNDKDLA